jgi:hypothetical protein
VRLEASEELTRLAIHLRFDLNSGPGLAIRPDANAHPLNRNSCSGLGEITKMTGCKIKILNGGKIRGSQVKSRLGVQNVDHMIEVSVRVI